MTQALLKYETLDAEDVKQILDGKTLDKPTVADLLKLEQKKAAQKSVDDDDYDIYAELDDDYEDESPEEKDPDGEDNPLG